MDWSVVQIVSLFLCHLWRIKNINTPSCKWNAFLVRCRVKVNVRPVQALRFCTGRTAHRGSRSIAVLYRHWGSVKDVRPLEGVELQLYSFLNTALGGDDGSASRPGRSLPPWKTRYPLCRRLDGSHDRSGLVRKISPPTVIWSADRPGRRQSL